MYKSFKVPSSEVPGYSATHRHPEYKDGTQNNKYANITTVYELFKTAETNHPKAEFLGTREFAPKTGKFGPFEWISTTDAAEITDEFGAGLDNVYAKYAPELDSFTGQQPLGIYSVNRAEWLLTELAGFRSRRYSVGVCDSAGVDCAEFIINHSGLQVIVCSLDKIPRMLDRMANTPKVKVIISMDKLDCSKPNLSTQAFTPATVDKLKSKAAALGLVLFDMSQVIQMGQSKPTQATLPKSSDYCTLCYSSGTTGAQKGVLTTHGGLIHAARSAQLTLKTENTTYLSFVPLVHCLDRYGIYTFMFGFIQIGFYSGDMNNLVDDMQTLRPTIIVAVPRLLNRIYDRIASSTIGAKGAVGFLSRMGFKSKVKRLQAGRSAKHALWDKLIFNKVANIFGGRVKLMISGAATIDPNVLTFFRTSFSCDVLQGYGQTENMGSTTLSPLGDPSTNHVGLPNPGVDVRLRSIPEMGYQVTDAPCPRGEVMVRSDSVFKGYYLEPDKTAETMDGEWLATGDVARINLDGTFTIIDRIKNIVKTAQGMWVAPERLESIYNTNPLVQTTFVHGDEHERNLIAIAVPDPVSFIPWARALVSQPKADLADLCANEKVAVTLAEQLKVHGALAGLSAQEQICAVHLEPTPFENVNIGFYTSTFKLRRRIMIVHYRKEFKATFAKLGTNDAAAVDTELFLSA